jgi:Fe-S-cluster containining protein
MVMRGRDGKNYRLRTITPRFENGKCIFLTDSGLCSIHAVAPYGCRYYDVHMSMAEGQKRSMWGAMQILENIAEYSAERDALPEATHYRPSSAV